MSLRFFHTGSLRRQLALIIIGISALAMLAAGATLFVSELARSRAAMQNELTSLALLLGDRSSAALVFLDEKTARENLHALAGIGHVESACLFTSDGRTLAHYARNGAPPASCQLHQQVDLASLDFDAARLRVQQPVRAEHTVIGAIQITASTAPLVERLAAQSVSLVVALGGALVLAAALALRLQRVISRPLAQMRDVANAVVESGDYSLRTTGSGAKELRELAHSFNRMLLKIQELNAQLLAQQAHLEEQVMERTAALAQTLQKANAANQAKSVFLSNMSHELRTPLNAVIGFSRLMARSEGLSEQQRENLGLINRSGTHLLTLINDVLELSKIEAGREQVDLQDTALRVLLLDVFNMLRQRAEQAGLKAQCELGELPVAMTDPVKLRQVLINLLGNAIKFTPSGQVCLSARGTALGQGAWRIDFEVSDTGIGIDPSQQESVFEPFTQLRGKVQEAGTGLGLTLSRQFVRLLGGELVVDSRLGEGARFSFSLQVQESLQQQWEAPEPDEVVGLDAPDRARRILVVDDRAEARALLRQVLEPLGFSIDVAEDGQLALERFAAQRPDLILMDWDMPRMDGLEATARLRAMPGGDVPIIMLTASALEEQRRQAMAAGASGFMRKPMQESELYALLEQHLGIQFRRRDSTAAMPTLDVEQLRALAPSMRLALQAAAMELDTDKLGSLLKAVDDAALAGRIQAMLDRHLYRELYALLDEAHAG